ncbi:hypothetical protein [Psychroflexus torquis]|uniref:hypothetical protein n=1 Tax=Psychroflexus torquis TaxID=57029 RepID=UPI0000D52AFD|nr:hypothetical protein [Psychroflexus torquis]
MNLGASVTHNVTIFRISTSIIGAIALLMALEIKSVLTFAWIETDFLTSGTFITLILVFLWAKGTATAATISILFGLVFSSYNLLIAFGAPFPLPEK